MGPCMETNDLRFVLHRISPEQRRCDTTLCLVKVPLHIYYVGMLQLFFSLSDKHLYQGDSIAK